MLFKLSYRTPLNSDMMDLNGGLSAADTDSVSLLPVYNDTIIPSVSPSADSVELRHAATTPVELLHTATTPVELNHATIPVQLAAKPAVPSEPKIVYTTIEGSIPSAFNNAFNPQRLDAETIGKRALGALAGLGIVGGTLLGGGYHLFERPFAEDLATGAVRMSDKAGELASAAGSKTKNILEEAIDYLKREFNSFTGGEKAPTTRANIPRAKAPQVRQTAPPPTRSAKALKEVENKAMTRPQAPIDKMKRQHIRQDVEKEEELGE